MAYAPRIDSEGPNDRPRNSAGMMAAMATARESSHPHLRDGVRLPRDRNISPTLLHHYATCPYRVRLQYIDQVPQPRRYNHHLSQGRIAHDLLRHAALCIPRNQPLPAPDQLFAMANRRVPWKEFPSPETRLGYVEQIVRWVNYGVAHLDRDAEYLVIERFRSRPFAGGDPREPVTLLFRPDLVLLRGDIDGEFIEVIDYKTGTPRPDPDVPVIARFILRPLLAELSPEPSAVRVRFTYLWLEHQATDEYDLDVDFCHQHWPRITGTIERLFAETEWQPNPSFRCNYCPYHGNACTPPPPASLPLTAATDDSAVTP